MSVHCIKCGRRITDEEMREVRDAIEDDGKTMDDFVGLECEDCSDVEVMTITEIDDA